MDPLTLLVESSICLGNKSIFVAFKDSKYRSILDSKQCRHVLGLESHRDNVSTAAAPFVPESSEASTIRSALAERTRQVDFAQTCLLLGLSALYAFLQANVTGPPPDWSDHKTPNGLAELSNADDEPDNTAQTAHAVSSPLNIDGTAIYPLASHINLFVFAKVLLAEDALLGLGLPALWARLRVNFWHQKLLAEHSPSLRAKIYHDLELLEKDLQSSRHDPRIWTWYLLERAVINSFYGFISKARQDLKLSSRNQHFEFALTGRLGKRTKFQQQDLSQLVVLARSAEKGFDLRGSQPESQTTGSEPNTRQSEGPTNLRLDDDTVLESISFVGEDEVVHTEPNDKLSPSLAALDPGNQPQLDPLDSIILLATASAITNTSPEDGLTREETLPYATRVIEGGSNNWQVYTQALLVRSRIEGHKTRTAERSVFQLQALVDQVIAETKGIESNGADGSTNTEAASTFLPRPKASESACAAQRLQYVHQISPPFRWSLEAELAVKWMSLGSLRTAVEIYERLQMWAEAALCWAATGKEEKARGIIRRRLQLPEAERDPPASLAEFQMQALELRKDKLPADAPRLLCILGDLESAPACYRTAWNVSNERYARAQRSLGKHYTSNGCLGEADEAYTLSLRVEPQNAGTCFSLGCVRLTEEDWEGSVEAFSRTIKIEPDDAEAWSNLGAALVRIARAQPQANLGESDSDETVTRAVKQAPRNKTREALVAFKRAAGLKRDSYQIWQNILNVAATIAPPPYADAVTAQRRLIELRGTAEGESCVDVEIMEGILSHIVSSATPAPDKMSSVTVPVAQTNSTRRSHGLERVFTELVMSDIKPLITHSRRLWQLVARLSLHRNQPSAALDAYEKAWRCSTSLPGWDDAFGAHAPPTTSGRKLRTEDPWSQVVDATIELVDAYESLGEREVTEGLGAESGQLVCKNWKFKAKMAVKSVQGRREKAGLGGTMTLEQRLQDLTAG